MKIFWIGKKKIKETFFFSKEDLKENNEKSNEVNND